MTIRRALAGALVLVGVPTLVLAVLGMLGGNGALVPIALLGLGLAGLGVRLVIDPRPARPGARRSRGGYVAAAHHPYPAPTGDVGWYGPAETGDRSDSGRSGYSDSGSSSGGWSGGDSGGFSGGGDSGGGGGGGGGGD
ncbi:hypothetical protein [Micromonospora sp. NPDC023956]|uniref:hypothetical protein n=1 Tax=Micromonospora sp. NPDC023956 TaxID=3155722 RepID=UPI003406EBC8